MFRMVGSKDKSLHMLRNEEGGVHHCLKALNPWYTTRSHTKRIKKGALKRRYTSKTVNTVCSIADVGLL